MTDFVETNGNTDGFKKYYRWQVGGGTDIGGSRENQDDFFVWESRVNGIMILCVLDGHGREVGKLASEAGRASLEQYFDENGLYLYTDPYKVLVEAFDRAHSYIKSRFAERLESVGWEVKEAEEGYFVKRKPNSSTWYCVHGGTSCSIVAIVGSKVYCANVGDSSGLLCADKSHLRAFNRTLLHPLGDAADPQRNGSDKYTDLVHSLGIPVAVDGALMITAEHSPECINEFDRLRRAKADLEDPQRPALHVVYDAQMTDKHSCPPVFEVDANTGDARVTNRGKYFKNVRREWASLVATPTTARFQDALAFTRSMGDLHLHVYGVSHLPEVYEVDLAGLLHVANQYDIKVNNTTNSNSTNGSDSSSNSSTGNEIDSVEEGTNGTSSCASSPTIAAVPLACIVLASDGVWDNWTYSDVSRFVMDPSCVNAVCSGADGAERVAESFMQRNAMFSKRNFGSQADNATGIILYLCEGEHFPEA